MQQSLNCHQCNVSGSVGPSITLVTVRSYVALGEGEQVWTHDRKVLEMAIQAEKLADQSQTDWNPDLQSEEQRLTKRLNNLALEMKVMAGDGNCQVETPPDPYKLRLQSVLKDKKQCHG
jgi:hypothetical protein